MTGIASRSMGCLVGALTSSTMTVQQRAKAFVARASVINNIMKLYARMLQWHPRYASMNRSCSRSQKLWNSGEDCSIYSYNTQSHPAKQIRPSSLTNHTPSLKMKLKSFVTDAPYYIAVINLQKQTMSSMVFGVE